MKSKIHEYQKNNFKSVSKKIFLIATLAFFGMTQAQVSFKPGLRGGVNFSHFTQGDAYEDYYYDNNGNYVSTTNREEFGSKTDFYVGFYGALQLSKFYTLQPEIDYSRQGATYKGNNGVGDTDLEVSYLSIAVINKFSFSKFNIHVGPTIDFQVQDNFPTENELDFAFVLGAGYNFTKNFGLEARVKKGIIPVLDGYNDDFYYGGDDHTNVVFSVGATYTFDVK